MLPPPRTSPWKMPPLCLGSLKLLMRWFYQFIIVRMTIWHLLPCSIFLATVDELSGRVNACTCSLRSCTEKRRWHLKKCCDLFHAPSGHGISPEVEEKSTPLTRANQGLIGATPRAGKTPRSDLPPGDWRTQSRKENLKFLFLESSDASDIK